MVLEVYVHEPLKGQSETRAARIDDGLVLKSFAKLLWVCPTHAQLVEAACDLYIQRIKGFPSLSFKPWCYNAILCNWGCPRVELIRESVKKTPQEFLLLIPLAGEWTVSGILDANAMSASGAAEGQLHSWGRHKAEGKRGERMISWPLQLILSPVLWLGRVVSLRVSPVHTHCTIPRPGVSSWQSWQTKEGKKYRKVITMAGGLCCRF